jgi:NAD(P)-dependent dehydrogenase (short-subunit alcohol dehydrogenase family)
VTELARKVRSRYERLDILINNAGLIIENRQTSAQGYEMTLAINHLGHFLLTHLLLDLLEKSPEARVINVSSEAHKYGRLDFSDLQLTGKYEAMRSYGNSKLANILFTRQLARGTESKGISVYSLHPGFVATGFGTQFSNPLYKVTMALMRPFAIDAETGAQTSIYLASSPEVKGKTGLYFVKNRPKKPSREALSDYNAKTLWDMSVQLTELDQRLAEVRKPSAQPQGHS